MAGKYLSQHSYLHTETIPLLTKDPDEASLSSINALRERLNSQFFLFKDAHYSAQCVAMLVDKADPLSKGHSCRVARYSAAIGSEMGMEKEDIEGLRVGGYLHDIGKIMLPAGILNKATILTDEEYREVKQHTILGHELLRGYEWIYPIEKIAYFHHEYHNGSGYPCGLSGEDIPLPARIVAVADAYDAMISKRGYSRPRSLPEIIGELRICSGSQFDPSVIDAYLSRIRRESEKGISPELTAFLTEEELRNVADYIQ